MQSVELRLGESQRDTFRGGLEGLVTPRGGTCDWGGWEERGEVLVRLDGPQWGQLLRRLPEVGTYPSLKLIMQIGRLTRGSSEDVTLLLKTRREAAPSVAAGAPGPRLRLVIQQLRPVWEAEAVYLKPAVEEVVRALGGSFEWKPAAPPGARCFSIEGVEDTTALAAGLAECGVVLTSRDRRVLAGVAPDPVEVVVSEPG